MKIFSAVLCCLIIFNISYPQKCTNNSSNVDAISKLVKEFEKGENGKWGDYIWGALETNPSKFDEIAKKYIPKLEKDALSTKNSNLLYNLGAYYYHIFIFRNNSPAEYREKSEKYLLMASDIGNVPATDFLIHNIFRNDIDNYIKYSEIYYRITGDITDERLFFALYLKGKEENNFKRLDELYRKYIEKRADSIRVLLLYASGKLGKDKVEFGIERLKKAHARLASRKKLGRSDYEDASVVYALLKSGTYLQKDADAAEHILNLAEDKLSLLKRIREVYFSGIKYLFSFDMKQTVYLLPPDHSDLDNTEKLIRTNGGYLEQLIFKFRELFGKSDYQNVLQKKRTPKYLKSLREVLPIADSILADNKASNWEKWIATVILVQLKETRRLSEFLKKNPPKTIEDFAKHYVFYIEGFCGNENRKKAGQIMEMADSFSPSDRNKFFISVADIYDDFLYFYRKKDDNSAEKIKYLELAVDCGVNAPYAELMHAYMTSNGLKNKYENMRRILKLALKDKNQSCHSALYIAETILRGEITEINYPEAISLLEYVANSNNRENELAVEESRLLLAMIYALADEPIRDEKKSRYWFEKFIKEIHYRGLYLQIGLLPFRENFLTNREDFFPDSKIKWNLPLDYVHNLIENGNTELASQLGYSYDELSEYKKAKETWEKGFNMGDPSCAYYLARFYFDGRRGYPVDYNKAIEYGIRFNKLSSEEWMKEKISKIILLSYERQKDFSSAFKYAQKIESKFPIFKEYIAYCYKLGLGVRKDTKKAEEIFNEILSSDIASSVYSNYSEYRDYPIFPANNNRKMELLKAAVKNTNADYLIYDLAALTIKEAKSFEDQKKGIDIYKKLDRDVWSNGAFLYYCCKHGIGMRPDAVKAEYLKQKIQSDCNMNDIMRIAYGFEDGSLEFIKGPDIEEAYSWFKFAAENGNTKAKKKIRSLKEQITSLSELDNREKRFNELAKESADKGPSIEYAKMLIEGYGCVKDIAAGLLILRNLSAGGNIAAVQEIGALRKKWEDTIAESQAGNAQNNEKLLDALTGDAYCELFGIGTSVNADRARKLIERAKTLSVSKSKHEKINEGVNDDMFHNSFDTLSLSDIYILRARKLLRDRNDENKLIEAHKLLSKASCIDNGIADAYLSQIYEDGLGVRKDDKKADFYFNEALRKSKGSSLLRLYRLYKDSDEDGFIRTNKNKIFIIERAYKE